MAHPHWSETERKRVETAYSYAEAHHGLREPPTPCIGAVCPNKFVSLACWGLRGFAEIRMRHAEEQLASVAHAQLYPERYGAHHVADFTALAAKSQREAQSFERIATKLEECHASGLWLDSGGHVHRGRP